MQNDMSILVISCDKYSDLWDVFFLLFNKFWVNCPYEVYLGTNYKKYMGESIASICIGEDLSWADNLKKMLSDIDTPYVLILLDDEFLDKRVDDAKIKIMLSYVKKHNLDCLKLSGRPVTYRRIDKDLDIGIYEPGSPYFITAHTAIWRKDSLKKLLRSGMSAWDFELKNSRNSFNYNYRIYGVNHKLISVRNGVVRGKFLKSSVDFLRKENVDIDVSKRGVVNDTNIISKIKHIIVQTELWLFIKLRIYKTRYRNVLTKNI